MGTNPRSAGFEPRASIFRGACAAPSGKDDDIEGMSTVYCCAMASSISSSHLHRDRRHPRRRLAYVAAVAIMRCRPIHDAGPAHPPGSYADVSSVLPRPPMSLLPPSGALQRALLAAFAAAASLSARHFCLQSLGAAIAVLSLSLGQLQPAVSGRHPLGSSPPPSPLNCLLLLLALSQEPGACV